jgi:hypothetical protein
MLGNFGEAFSDGTHLAGDELGVWRGELSMMACFQEVIPIPG